MPNRTSRFFSRQGEFTLFGGKYRIKYEFNKGDGVLFIGGVAAVVAGYFTEEYSEAQAGVASVSLAILKKVYEHVKDNVELTVEEEEVDLEQQIEEENGQEIDEITSELLEWMQCFQLETCERRRSRRQRLERFFTARDVTVLENL